MHITNLLLTQ